MNKKCLLFLLLALPFAGFTQSSCCTTDSASYYRLRMSQQMRAVQDSLMNTAEFMQNQEGLKRHSSKSNDYTAFTLALEIAHNNYSGINSQLKAADLKTLPDVMMRIGFGVSRKSCRFMNDIYFGNIGFSNNSEQDSGTFKSSLVNLFQYDFGYDLLKSERFSIYPYAGLSLRLSTISYESPKVIDNDYTNITEIVVNNQSYNSTSTRLGWQAGITFDASLGIRREAHKKTILSLKFGTNRPFKDDSYKIHGVKYTPTGVQADWLISIGWKFASW